MKKVSVLILTVGLLTAVLTTPACKGFVWDPTGSWTFTNILTYNGFTWTENLVFSGTEDGGTVTGFTQDGYVGSQTTTWSKTGDFTITFTFTTSAYYSYTFVFNCTSSEDSPNNISGTGQYTSTSGTSSGMTITAVKTSSLQ